LSTVYQNNALVTKVTSKASLPEGRYTSTEILDAVYRTLLTELVPIVKQVNQEYYVVNTTSATVAQTYAYSLPDRCMGRALREVKRVKSGKRHDLPIGSLEYEDPQFEGDPRKCWIEGDQLIVWPTPSDATNSLLIWFYRRPSILVPNDEGFIITNIDTGTNIVTVTGTPGFDSTQLIDVISDLGDFTIREEDQAFTDLTASAFTFATLPTNMKVGDYICKAGESIYAQLPVEAHEILVELTAANLMFEMGDAENGARARADGERLAQAYLSTIANRIVGAPKAFTSRLI
jgi:hypothetical protein